MSKMTKHFTVSFDVKIVLEKDVMNNLIEAAKEAREVVNEGLEIKGEQFKALHLLRLLETGNEEGALEFLIRQLYREGITEMLSEVTRGECREEQRTTFSPVSIKFREA